MFTLEVLIGTKFGYLLSRRLRPRGIARTTATAPPLVLLLRATLDVPKPNSGGLVKKVGPFSKRKNPL